MATKKKAYSVSDFLKSIGLERYESKLLEEGWDDLNFLQTLSTNELHKIAQSTGMLPGHLAKFVTKLKGKAKLPLASITPSVPSQPDPQEDKTFIAMVVDRSGSMQSVGNEAMNGFNAFVEKQKQGKGTCNMTVARFDNVVEILQDNVPIKDVTMATPQTFAPRGMTALYDAIGTVVTKAELLTNSGEYTKIIVVILTDGQENASKKYDINLILAIVNRLKNDPKWEFIFMGANQDAVLSGSSMGFAKRACITFTADPEHTQKTFAVASDNCTRGRLGQKMAFTKLERCTTTDA